MMKNFEIFMVWGRLTRSNGPSRAQGSALTRNVIQYMARRTCFREQYYTGTRGIILGRVDSRPRPKKTICTFGSVFHQYLEIAVFVWDRAVCGTRYWVGAGCGCSGVAQKINMRKIRLDQGLVHDEEF